MKRQPFKASANSPESKEQIKKTLIQEKSMKVWIRKMKVYGIGANSVFFSPLLTKYGGDSTLVCCSQEHRAVSLSNSQKGFLP